MTLFKGLCDGCANRDACGNTMEPTKMRTVGDWFHKVAIHCNVAKRAQEEVQDAVIFCTAHEHATTAPAEPEIQEVTIEAR
jgi:hypothetical protein